MHDGAALEKGLSHLVIGHQVQVTLAVANLGVLQPVPLGGRRAQRLGQDGEALDLDANLASLGSEQSAPHSDEIAEVEVLENVILLLAQDVLLRVNLDAPGLVLEIEELAFAHVPVRRDAPGQRDGAAFGVVVPGVRALLGGDELVLERIETAGAQPGQLGFALFDELISVFHKVAAGANQSTGRQTMSRVCGATVQRASPGQSRANPNSEARIPKPERNPNSEFRRRSARTGWSVRTSGFGFLSGLGLRISEFNQTVDNTVDRMRHLASVCAPLF